MRTKHILETPYELDYIVLGINSHAKEYKLCWSVNKTLQLDLEKTDTNNNKEWISSYTYNDSSSKTEYTLFVNQIREGYLFPKRKNINYFLKIKNPLWEQEKTEFIKKLKEVPEVLLIFELDTKEIENIENKIFNDSKN